MTSIPDDVTTNDDGEILVYKLRIHPDGAWLGCPGARALYNGMRSTVADVGEPTDIYVEKCWLTEEEIEDWGEFHGW